jgi:hypothetical protein
MFSCFTMKGGGADCCTQDHASGLAAAFVAFIYLCSMHRCRMRVAWPPLFTNTATSALS